MLWIGSGVPERDNINLTGEVLDYFYYFIISLPVGF